MAAGKKATAIDPKHTDAIPPHARPKLIAAGMYGSRNASGGNRNDSMPPRAAIAAKA